MGGVRGESGGANEESALIRSHREGWMWGKPECRNGYVVLRFSLLVGKIFSFRWFSFFGFGIGCKARMMGPVL